MVKGGGGLRRAGLASTAATVKVALSSAFFRSVGLDAGADIETLELLSVGADQAGFETVAARRRQLGDDRPIFLGDEFLDFQFAVADQPQRDRLHAAGRARARQLAPEHRREREADQIIERAARQIGVDQRAVDGARMLHRLGHRLLGDRIEDDALDRLALERLLFIEGLQDVPGDRLAFAVGVGRQNEGVGLLQGVGDVVDALLRLGVDLPEHLEIIVRVDRSVLGREVPDMAKGRQDLVTGAQVLVDRLRLGRRLDNDNFHENPMGYPPDTVAIHERNWPLALAGTWGRHP